MDTYILATTQGTFLFCLGLVSMTLFLMIWVILMRITGFSEDKVALLSFYATSLSLIAIGQMFASPQTRLGQLVSFESEEMLIIILSYAVAGIYFLVIFAMISLVEWLMPKIDKCIEVARSATSKCQYEQKTEPVAPTNLPSSLNTEHEPPIHISTDHANSEKEL